MKYIGNYADWINPDWVNELINATGMGRPRDGKTPDSAKEEFEYARARQAGYKDTDVYFWMFDKNNVSFDLPIPPFITGKYHWL